MEETERVGSADLVAGELVNASAITMIQPSMFAVRRRFAISKEREGLAEWNREQTKAQDMPAHHDSMAAQKHESSSS